MVLNYDEKVSKQQGYNYYKCRCDCSAEQIVKGANLRNGNSQSCGCLRRKICSKQMSKMNKQLNKLRTGENNPSHYHGIYTERRKFRKYVRERDKICLRCGMTREENGRELDAHHLDGDEYNNDPKNGSSLCRGCHAAVTRNGNIWRPE